MAGVPRLQGQWPVFPFVSKVPGSHLPASAQWRNKQANSLFFSEENVALNHFIFLSGRKISRKVCSFVTVVSPSGRGLESAPSLHFSHRPNVTRSHTQVDDVKSPWCPDCPPAPLYRIKVVLFGILFRFRILLLACQPGPYPSLHIEHFLWYLLKGFAGRSPEPGAKGRTRGPVVVVVGRLRLLIEKHSGCVTLRLLLWELRFGNQSSSRNIPWTPKARAAPG